jgi:hypothetical protein
MQEHHEDTHESDALGGGEVRFDRQDAEAIGDPAAASVEAEGAVPGDPAGIAAEPGAGWEPPGTGEETPGTGEETPAAADRRGAEQAEDPPIIPIAGAFVGAFVAAKLLGRLGGGGD